MFASLPKPGEIRQNGSEGIYLRFKENAWDCCTVFEVLFGAPGRDRTCDTRLRKPVLYPLSYGRQTKSPLMDIEGQVKRH